MLCDNLWLESSFDLWSLQWQNLKTRIFPFDTIWLLPHVYFVFLFHINLVSVSFSLLCVVSCLSWFPCVVIDVTCCKRVFGLSLPVTSGDQYSSRNSRQGYLKSVGMGCFGGCIVPWSNGLPPCGLQHM